MALLIEIVAAVGPHGVYCTRLKCES